MGKRFFDKRCKYSIRKFSVGVASVMIGATFFVSPIALATEAETPTEGNGTISESPALDKLPDDVLKAIEKAEKEAEANKPDEDEATSHEEAKPTEAETTTAATEVKPTEEATTTQATTTETNTATETTKPREVNGTVEKADQYQADKPATKAEIDAAKKEVTKKEYTVFPTPQKVTYGDGVTALEGTVNLVFSDNLDIYTRNRAKEVLQANNVSYTTSTKEAEGATNIFLGVHGESPLAEKEVQDISPDLYNKIDAYVLRVKNNKISIVGKDTDAVFFGLTTLKHMLGESPTPVLRDVTVEDYAEVKNRGFIEGYYGNPWTKQNREDLMRYGGELKLTQYYFAPKDDPYHNAKWRELYPDEKLAEIRDLARVGNETKTRYVWTIHLCITKCVLIRMTYIKKI